MKCKTIQYLVMALIVVALTTACGRSVEAAAASTLEAPRVLRQWGAVAIASSEFGNNSWSAMQATGAPDTLECADLGTAWASLNPNTVETLDIYYDIPVYATGVNIYQTYNPDQVVRVELIGSGEDLIEVYSQSPEIVQTPCPYVLPVRMEEKTDFLVYGVRITLDQTALQSWNEIDAIELVGESRGGELGNAPTTAELLRQWASEGVASSEYGPDNWSATQATGAPDTPECFDISTAWASLSPDTVETLMVYYDVPVHATEVHIYQTYNPDQVSKVEWIGLGDYYEAIYTHPPGFTEMPCPYILSVTAEEMTDFLVHGVRITIDQTVLQDWNEIDAVELVGIPEKEQ